MDVRAFDVASGEARCGEDQTVTSSVMTPGEGVKVGNQKSRLKFERRRELVHSVIFEGVALA